MLGITFLLLKKFLTSIRFEWKSPTWQFTGGYSKLSVCVLEVGEWSEQW